MKLNKLKEITMIIGIATLTLAGFGVDGYMYMDNPITPIIVLMLIGGLFLIISLLIGGKLEHDAEETKRIHDSINRSNSYNMYDISE